MARKKKGFRDPLFDPDPQLFHPPAADCWYGVCLRARVPRGRVLGMVHPPLPPNMLLVGPEGIPGNDAFQVLKTKFPLLSEGEIHYVGEPLALLVGENEHEVQEFAQKVRFLTSSEKTESQPPVVERRVTKGYFSGESPGQGCRVVEGTYLSGAQDHGRFDALEVLAQVTPASVAVRVKTQWPAHVVASVAKALDVEPTTVLVLATTTAGITGSQVWFPSLYAVYAALLSRACRKPVLLRLTREEDFFYSPKRPECKTTLRSVVDAQGKILSLQGELTLQTGAWPVLAEEILDRALVGLLTPYALAHFDLRGVAESSPTPPRGPVGTQGEALGTFALECHVQDICRELDLDPAQWRMDQVVARDQAWFTGLIPRIENPLRAVVAETTRVTDFSRKQAAFELLRERRDSFRHEALPWRGIGLAAGFQGNGFLAGGASPVHMEGRLEENGQLSLYIPLVTSNERLVDLWKQSAASALQIPVGDVRICPVFSGDHPVGGPSWASRAFEIIPRLLLQTCEGIAQRRFRQPLPITVKSIYRRSRGPAWNSDEFTGQPFLTLSWAAAVAEVELIPHRAEIEVKHLSLVVEAGPRIDEAAARNSLVEGVQMAVGWALTEVFTWDRLSHDGIFSRYRLPGPRELPPVDIRFLETEKESRPRGLGNLGAHVIAPALLGAMRQALGPSLKSIPVSRKMLDEALRNHENTFHSER